MDPIAAGPGEDHSCEDLSGFPFDLTFGNLSEANLSYADLTEAFLFDISLQEADLTGAVLVDANLGFAGICGANFSGADLTGANMAGTGQTLCGTLFNPWPPASYDCDTIWTDTLYDTAQGGVDPQDAGWTLLNPPCATTLPYGTLAPPGSLEPASGRPKLGQPFSVQVDDPLGGSAPGSFVALLVSKQPDPNHFDPLTPDGTLLPGYGMDGGVGELLVDLSGGAYLATVPGASLWSSPGSPVAVDLAVPNDPALSGFEVYTQGVLVVPDNAKLTEGLILLLGN